MIINGDSRYIAMRSGIVQCTVTSPPYFHMRDYGVIGQLGDERTPEEFISNLVAVFSEVYRVSRPDSILWLNISDSYAGSAAERASKLYGVSKTKLLKEWGYHTKEELDIPHRLANAIRSIGWQKRCTVIWSKPNPMPESVTDRPTKAHEYLFLMAKQERYYYDAEAVREEADYDGRKDTIMKGSDKYSVAIMPGQSIQSVALRGHERWPDRLENGKHARNRRSVWTIPTAPYKGAHFATFPPALVEPCIKAGTSERGVCPKCGKGWRRVVEKESHYEKRQDRAQPAGVMAQVDSSGWSPPTIKDNGWLPACSCNAGDPIPALVFDPFAGSGTTVKVAFDLGRVGIGLDLSLKYLDKQATKRIHNGHTGRLV